MASVAMPKPTYPANRNLERAFFGGMAVLLTVSVVYGFGPTYFFAGLNHAPLKSTLLHIHGAVFTLWFVLYDIQTFLIPAGRVAWHRTFGLASYCVAAVMVPLGVLAANQRVARDLLSGEQLEIDPRTFYIISITAMVLFAVLITASYLQRRRPFAHKRLVLFAALALMPAAINRWPSVAMNNHPWTYLAANTLFDLLPLLYDLVALRRVLRVTWLATALILVLHQLQFPIGETALWHSFATWAAGLH
jgi:hypothetical protein